jgi:hypothetical protein
MPSLKDWSPYKTHVQGGLREGNFVNGQFILISAGPAFYSEITLDEQSGLNVYPIGLTQNIALSQNKAISRIFEIGSDRSYFISGRSVGQLSLGRVIYHGPSLLRCLYAGYDTLADVGGYQIAPLVPSSASLATPFSVGSEGGASSARKSIRIPPGYGNMFLNLASDLFSQPLGLLLQFYDNNRQGVASVYLDQCYVPQHSIAVDAQGLIVQESVGIQYERMQPVKLAQLGLLNSVLPDQSGGYRGGQDTTSEL